MSDTALIENLYARAKGLAAIYDDLEARSAAIQASIQAVLSQMALGVFVGRPDITTDTYTTLFEYARATYQYQNELSQGRSRPDFRHVILPGDGTGWMTYPWNGTTIYPQGSSALNAPVTPSAGTNPPFFIPRPYFDFSAATGQMQTTSSFTFGFVKESLPIIQLNACFQLPRVANVSGRPSDLGFGLVDRPIGTAGCVGVWIEPQLSGGTWARPWPVVVNIANGSSVTPFTIGDLSVPGGDAAPGGLTISWNRSRIGLYLFRGQAGVATTAGTIPEWWVYPWAPWQWPFPWPYLEQTLLGQWGDQTVYPDITPFVLPPIAPVKVACSWPGMLASEIDIEEVPLYPVVPGNTTTTTVQQNYQPPVTNPPPAPVSNGPWVWVLYRGSINEPEAVPVDYNIGSDPTLAHFAPPTPYPTVNGVQWTPLAWRVAGSTSPYTSADYTTYGLTGVGFDGGVVNPGNLVVESSGITF